MDNIVYLDIETRRTRSNLVRDYLVRDVQPDRRLKDPAKIEADIEKKGIELYEQTPLMPMWGEIACIAWSHQGRERTAHGDDETAILESFNAAMKQIRAELNGRNPRWCGFNLSFDLRFIWSRMLVRRVPPAISMAQSEPPWSGAIIDLRTILSGTDRYARGTLQAWMVAMGNEPRLGDIPGAEVPQAIEDGRMDEVVEHCLRDVRDCVWLHGKLDGFLR